jgi:hypothetical protein
VVEVAGAVLGVDELPLLLLLLHAVATSRTAAPSTAGVADLRTPAEPLNMEPSPPDSVIPLMRPASAILHANGYVAFSPD